MRLACTLVICGLLITKLSACTRDIQYQPTRALVEQVQGKEIVVNRTAEVQLGTNANAQISAGSRWMSVGTIPEGEVYKAVGSVFVLKQTNIYEAYLVLSGDSLNGFYLPYEKGFSPVITSIRLKISQPRP